MMAAFYEAIGPEIDTLYNKATELPAQLMPHLVTWGIERLESIYAVQSDPSKSLEERRSVLIARIRSTGSSTVKQITGIAASFSHGSILVREDPAKYSVEIEFIDDMGVPPFMDALKSTLRMVVPAHLAMVFVLRWLTWGDLSQSGMPWADLGALHKTWDEIKTYHV